MGTGRHQYDCPIRVGRPALVIDPEAYCRTALLRVHTGFPVIEWRMFEDAQTQTKSLGDVK